MRFWHPGPVLAALILIMVQQAALAAGEPLSAAAVAAPQISDKVVFLAAGRQGYGDAATRTVALSMERIAAARGDVNFTLLLGDNFYPAGVASTDDVLWKTRFEDLYDSPHQLGMPYYAILGNHDHDGDWKAQVRYARQKSGTGRWHMDAPYYMRDFGEADGRPVMRVVFLDSIRLNGVGALETRLQALLTRRQQITFLKRAFSPEGPQPLWKVVASHYPVRSLTGLAFSRARVMDDLAPLMTDLGVDLILSANDRFQQILDDPPEPLHVGTNGGGRKMEERDLTDTPSELAVSQRGFVVVSVEPRQIAVSLVNAEGIVTHQRRRLRSPPRD